MNGISGKRALVTGGASGIGKSIVEELCRRGAHVVALDQNEPLLEELKKTLPSITTLTVDLCDWEATRKAVQSVLPLPLVVNCAGISGRDSCIEARPDFMNRMFSIHTFSTINICQVVGNDLIARKMEGSFVNVSSVTANFIGDGMRFSYSLSKICVEMATKHFAFLLGPHGIRVNCVSPTLVKGGMGDFLRSNPEALQGVIDVTMTKELPSINDIVGPVIFLLSENSKVITGHNLPLDAGTTAK